MSRRRRLRDSAARRRRRALAGWALGLVGVVLLVLAFLTARVEQPEAFAVTPDGTTEVPRTYAVHNPWVLYAKVADPRRVPTLERLGCHARGDLVPPVQPPDMTAYGSRVVEEVSISAVAVLGRSGEGARLVCEDAARFAPLLMAPSSLAPPFAPSGILILGAVFLVAGALAHPKTDEVPSALRRMLARSRDE